MKTYSQKKTSNTIRKNSIKSQKSKKNTLNNRKIVSKKSLKKVGGSNEANESQKGRLTKIKDSLKSIPAALTGAITSLGNTSLVTNLKDFGDGIKVGQKGKIAIGLFISVLVLSVAEYGSDINISNLKPVHLNFLLTTIVGSLGVLAVRYYKTRNNEAEGKDNTKPDDNNKTLLEKTKNFLTEMLGVRLLTPAKLIEIESAAMKEGLEQGVDQVNKLIKEDHDKKKEKGIVDLGNFGRLLKRFLPKFSVERSEYEFYDDQEGGFISGSHITSLLPDPENLIGSVSHTIHHLFDQGGRHVNQLKTYYILASDRLLRMLDGKKVKNEKYVVKVIKMAAKLMGLVFIFLVINYILKDSKLVKSFNKIMDDAKDGATKQLNALKESNLVKALKESTLVNSFNNIMDNARHGATKPLTAVKDKKS